MIDLYKLNTYLSLNWFKYSFFVLFIYIILAFLGLSFGTYDGVVVIWLPAGIALAAFFVFGYRIWFSLFIASFVLNYYLLISANTNLIDTIIVAGLRAIGNTAAPIFGYFFINFLTNKEHPLKNLNNIIIFLLFGGIISNIISSILGAYSSVLLYNNWENLFPIFFDWWLGNIASVIIITPLFLNYNKKDLSFNKPSKILEYISLTIFLYIIIQVFFVVDFILPLSIVLPALLIFIFRFGKFEATLSVLLLTIFSVLILYNPDNVFLKVYPINPLIPLTFLLISTAITTIIISTVLDVDRQRRKKLTEKNDELNRWYQLTLDREERNIELKKEVNELLEKQGNPKKYLTK